MVDSPGNYDYSKWFVPVSNPPQQEPTAPDEDVDEEPEVSDEDADEEPEVSDEDVGEESTDREDSKLTQEIPMPNTKAPFTDAAS